jgi:DNA-binding protein HU-beta
VNKTDLVAAVADATGATKVDVTKMLDALLRTITRSLAAKKPVRLVGFGTFKVVQRKKTEGRNPKTGAKITIPASQQPKFTAGLLLKKAVNK